MTEELNFIVDDPTVTHEMEKSRDRVMKHLKDTEQTRNSDRFLYFKIIEETCDHIYKEGELDALMQRALDHPLDSEVRIKLMEVLWTSMRSSPKPSTIGRVRRQIQNKEYIYLPTNPEVRKARKIREASMSIYWNEEKKIFDHREVPK